MKCNLLLSAALLTVCVGVLGAQQPANEAPPLALNTFISTHMISVPPVTGAPFTATVKVKSERTLADGSQETLETINIIGRDSQGRTHGENRVVVPNSFQGEPPLVEVIVFDPETHMRTSYNVATHTARRQRSFAPRGGPDESNQQVKVEDLGFMTIENLTVRGTRRTFTIPADKSGTGAPLAIVDEFWYSEDLHLNLLMRHSDPRLGMRTFSATNISRDEPPLSLFELAGYKIVDATSQEN